jgi:hypothetical protein
MPPKRRPRTIGSGPQHHGRVTPKAGELPRDTDTEVSRYVSRTTGSRERASPNPSSRYTPPLRTKRMRPGWHTALGAGLAVLGLLVIVVNDAMLFGSITLLPGGHNELYLMLGVTIAAWSTWWFGWFDRAK